MSVRTYNPSVRVGNWNEDVQLEEDTLKDFLARRERGELLIQQSSRLKDTALQQVSLSVSRDGCVHFGDAVMIVNAATSTRKAAALSTGVTGLSAAADVNPSTRNTFTITSCDGSSNGDTLHFGQAFYITTGDGQMFVQSDRATFAKCAKKSRHNEVTLSASPSHLTKWCIQPFDPLTRMELEFTPVPANKNVIIVHIKTNNNLCNEVAHLLKMPFGMEYEVSTYTSLDSHKAETDENHWQVALLVPGDGSMANIGNLQ